MTQKTIPFILLDVLKKPKGGYQCLGIDALGNTIKLHTYTNYGHLCSENTIYNAHIEQHEVPNTPGYTFFTLKGMEPTGSLDYSADREYHTGSDTIIAWLKAEGWFGVFPGSPIMRIRSAVIDYLNKPTRYAPLDIQNVWQHAKTAQKPTLDLGFLQTADPSVETYSKAAAFIVNTNRDFFTAVNQVKRPYGNKMDWMTTDPGNFYDSQLTTMLTKPMDLHTVNEFPKTGVSLYVDSATLQVAFKERHISDIFLYFAINSWMHKTGCYPNTSAKDVCTFLRSFIKNPRIARAGKAILYRLHNIGLLKLDMPRGTAKNIKEDTVVSLLSQQKYISKYEAKWNAVRRVSLNPKLIIGKPHVVRNKKWHRTSRVCGQDDQPLSKAASYLQHVWQPYFTIYANKTTKTDTGFIHLLNCGKTHMMSWLYEHIVSAWAYPTCRSKIAANLLIVPSTQRLLEKVNVHLQKRYNFIEIPDYLAQAIDAEAMLKIRTNGKFKHRNGLLYRQEGNDFESDRVSWKESDTCGRFRLSPKFIKAWQLSRPVHTKNNNEVCMPHYRPVPSRVLRGQPMPTTYVSKKAELQTGNCFALRRNGLAIPTTNPDNWIGFEPLAEYDHKNGDLLVPLNPSMKPPKNVVYGGREAVVETTNLKFFSTLQNSLSEDLYRTADHHKDSEVFSGPVP